MIIPDAPYVIKHYSKWAVRMPSRSMQRIYFSEHLLRDVIPIWDHYSTETMVITRDLLTAELELQRRDPNRVFAQANVEFRWVHSVLTPPAGIELRVLDMPGVLGWGFIESM